MDELRLELLPEQSGQDPRYRQATILINGVALLDLVRRIEEPLALAEAREEMARDPSLADKDAAPVPGSYMYPTLGMLRETPAEFFGPIETLFTLTANDPSMGKTCVLACDCGDPGCWPLLVRIERMGSTISWSDFAQFHRDWSYDLGPFVFDAAQYHRELERFRSPAVLRILR